jgi:hypothetical protein
LSFLSPNDCRDRAAKKAIYGKILRRSLILFSLGLLLAVGGNSDLAHLRIQACCKRIATGLFARLDSGHSYVCRWQVVIAIGFAAALLGADGQGAGAGIRRWQVGTSRSLRSPVIWTACVFYRQNVQRDLGSGGFAQHFAIRFNGSLAVFCAGPGCGRSAQPSKKVVGLLLGGAVCFGLGYLVNLDFPIQQKYLWSSSFVLVTSGLAAVGLESCTGLSISAVGENGPGHSGLRNECHHRLYPVELFRQNDGLQLAGHSTRWNLNCSQNVALSDALCFVGQSDECFALLRLELCVLLVPGYGAFLSKKDVCQDLDHRISRTMRPMSSLHREGGAPAR